MQKVTLYIGILLCVVIVSCEERKNVEAIEYDSIDYSYNRANRDRRWEINYKHGESSYTPERRDYHSSRQESLSRIVSLLEDISASLKRPQTSVNHPIYVPYPVPYPISIPVSSFQKGTSLPTITGRGPEILDSKSSGPVNSYLDEDGARPISFVPIRPDRAQKRLAPKVEHGSVQEDIGVLTAVASIHSSISSPHSSAVKTCTAAVLVCCVNKLKQERRNCLYSFGCEYNDGDSCRQDLIRDALESFNSQYPALRS